MWRLLILVVVMAFSSVSCGGDDTPEASNELSITVSDFAFDPDKVAVPPGQQITVELNNVGSVEHDWVVLDEGVRIEAESDLPADEAALQEDFVYFDAHVEPGETSTVTFTAPDRGTFQIICTVPGHFTSGMEGRLQVVSEG